MDALRAEERAALRAGERAAWPAHWWAMMAGDSYLMCMIVDPHIESYIASLDGQADPVLSAMETLAARKSFPIIGRHAGALLALLARCIGARRVLELGSGYGYSALWFARALPEDGTVVCTDLSRDNRDLAINFFHTAGIEKKISFHVGDALAFARDQQGPFDIILNDIEKEFYPASVAVAVPLLRSGGLFITDNTLWSGKVADASVSDASTKAIRLFNKAIFSRGDLESLIIPIRDGLTVCRKK
jgi:caffeoyl-CoA O-methyltransferase